MSFNSSSNQESAQLLTKTIEKTMVPTLPQRLEHTGSTLGTLSSSVMAIQVLEKSATTLCELDVLKISSTQEPA